MEDRVMSLVLLQIGIALYLLGKRSYTDQIIKDWYVT